MSYHTKHDLGGGCCDEHGLIPPDPHARCSKRIAALEQERDTLVLQLNSQEQFIRDHGCRCHRAPVHTCPVHKDWVPERETLLADRDAARAEVERLLREYTAVGVTEMLADRCRQAATNARAQQRDAIAQAAAALERIASRITRVIPPWTHEAAANEFSHALDADRQEAHVALTALRSAGLVPE